MVSIGRCIDLGMGSDSVIPGWNFSFLVVDTMRVVFCRNDIMYYAQAQQSKSDHLPTASPNRAKQMGVPSTNHRAGFRSHPINTLK